MTNKNIYKSLGGLDPELIMKAAPAEKAQKKKKNAWIKWGSLAACFCIMLVSIVLAVRYFDNQSFSIAQTVEFNNAEYFICSSKGEAAILEEANLPTVLTQELAGKQLAYLKVNDNFFSVTETVTDYVLYEYAPFPNSNVYIVLIDGNYYAAIRHDSNGYHGIVE